MPWIKNQNNHQVTQTLSDFKRSKPTRGGTTKVDHQCLKQMKYALWRQWSLLASVWKSCDEQNERV